MREVSDLGPFKALKWQALQVVIARRVFLRIFLLAMAVSSFPLMQLVPGPASNFVDCGGDSDPGYLGSDSFLGWFLRPVNLISLNLGYAQCKIEDLATDVVVELTDKRLLSHDWKGKALFVGVGSGSVVSTLQGLGFSDVDGVYRHSLFSRKRMEAIYELDRKDCLFDFVLVRDLNEISISAVLVNEMERVLKPGGVGAVLVRIEGSDLRSLIRSVNPVSASLKRSDVVHVTSLSEHILVAFRKRLDSVLSFVLPANCPSMKTKKGLIDRMEPLVHEKPINIHGRITHLPSLINVSRESRLVYVDMGARDTGNYSDGNWFLPSYPINSSAFDVFVVDHDALVLTSHVNKPGITFIYHPGLAGNTGEDNYNSVQDVEIPFEDDEFDFLSWFMETVEAADFVVLKMSTGKMELRFLIELFESKAICSVDEVFLQCSDSDLQGASIGSCVDLLKGLRSSGVFVHQWWGI